MRSDETDGPSRRRLLARVLGAALLALPAACGSWPLPPESEVPGMRALAEERKALPSRTIVVEAGRVGGEPLHVAMEELDSAADDRVIVLLHGVLSNRRTWRYVAGHLGREHDLLLIDLPGCGESDKPKPWDLSPDAYSPAWLGERVLLALRAYLATRPPDAPRPRLTLVGHSLGGTIALRMLGNRELRRDYDDVISMVDGAVLVSPVDAAVEKVNPTFAQIATLSDFEVFFARLFGILRARTSEAVYYGTCDPTTMPREELDRLYAVLDTEETRDPAQAMIRRAVPFVDDRYPDWPGIERIEAEYRNVDVPCLILWGRRDETFPVSMGYKLEEQLPDARLRVLPRTMHTVLSERPWLCAQSIGDFVASGGSGWPAVDEVDATVVEASTSFKKGQIAEPVFRRAVEAAFGDAQRMP
jgi:pimeloyl-ACP methyl ester carboxylesterase